MATILLQLYESNFLEDAVCVPKLLKLTDFWLTYSTTPRSSALARERILFKLCILAPCYLDELCVPVSTVPNLPVLRSAAVAICLYPDQGYNSATVHFVWLVRSPGTVSLWRFIPHL